MIFKRFRKTGKISKPYYTQNNEQPISNLLGKLRKKIESEVGGEKPYDVYRMVSDQAKRINVLESIIKKLDPSCVLEPKLDIGDATDVYKQVDKRMNDINKILDEVKEK